MPRGQLDRCDDGTTYGFTALYYARSGIYDRPSSANERRQTPCRRASKVQHRIVSCSSEKVGWGLLAPLALGSGPWAGSLFQPCPVTTGDATEPDQLCHRLKEHRGLTRHPLGPTHDGRRANWKHEESEHFQQTCRDMWQVTLPLGSTASPKSPGLLGNGNRTRSGVCQAGSATQLRSFEYEGHRGRIFPKATGTFLSRNEIVGSSVSISHCKRHIFDPSMCQWCNVTEDRYHIVGVLCTSLNLV